jgi:hypothetical protein
MIASVWRREYPSRDGRHENASSLAASCGRESVVVVFEVVNDRVKEILVDHRRVDDVHAADRHMGIEVNGDVPPERSGCLIG